MVVDRFIGFSENVFMTLLRTCKPLFITLFLQLVWTVPQAWGQGADPFTGPATSSGGSLLEVTI